MKKRIRVGRASVVVEMPPLVDRVTSAGAFGRVRSTIEAAAGRLRDAARAGWPVNGRKRRRPERSRDALEVFVRVSPPHRLEAGVRPRPGSAAEEYIFYIRSTKVKGSRGHAWTALIRRPGQKMGRRVAEESAELLARLGRGDR